MNITRLNKFKPILYKINNSLYQVKVKKSLLAQTKIKKV